MRRAHLALLAAPALAALQGCGEPLLFAELQVPDLRLSVPSQPFPASDTTNPNAWCTAAQTNPPCIQLTLDYDLGGNVPLLNERNVKYDLRLRDVAIALSPASAGTTLAGVKLVSIRVLSDPLDPTSGVVVASYARPAGGAATGAVSVAGNSNLDLGPYLRAGRLPVRVEVVLDQPTPAFLADVATGFSLEVKLDYGALL
jgi:hypothetical protein